MSRTYMQTHVIMQLKALSFIDNSNICQNISGIK
jgi:hypothetical protein